MTEYGRRTIFLLLLLPVLVTGELASQSIDTIGPVRITDPATTGEARDLVDRFFRFGSDPAGVDSVDVPDYAVDWLAEFLLELRGKPFWHIAHRYDVGEVWSIRPEGTILMVGSRTHVDSIPFHGRVTVDWFWYLRRNDSGQWRISNVRRTQGILEGMNTLRLIDTSAAYPPSVKAEVAREEGNMLLDNGMLRAEFEKNRGVLDELVSRLGANTSITLLERQGSRIRQFNRKYIDWGLAFEEIPEKALEEFLAGAPEEVRQNVLRRMEVAARHEREGTAVLAESARGAGVRPAEVEEIARLMKLARVKFINTELPFRDAILLTLGGELEQAVGYLYSPHGELPWINPEEYFYLEDLGDGWWIFRSA